MRRRTAAVFIAKLLLSVGLLWLVLAKVQVGAIMDVLAKADPWLVVLWYTLFPVIMALTAWRWETLAPGVNYRVALKYTWIGVFFGHLLPGSIAGDVAKGVSLALKDTSARAGLAASIVADKFIGLAALIVLFDFACAVTYFRFGAESPQVRPLAGIAMAITLAGMVGATFSFAMMRRNLFMERGRPGLLGRLIEGIGTAAQFYRNKPALLVRAFLISLAIHFMNIVATYLSFRALRVDGTLLQAAVIYPIVSVMLLIPISVSGIGVRDATLAVLFTLFGLPAASGVAIAWLNLLAVIPNVMIGGTIQLIEMYRKP
jgi:uncharacterized protein (TIRG00374 family)